MALCHFFSSLLMMILQNKIGILYSWSIFGIFNDGMIKNKENGPRLVFITLGGISAIGRTTDVALWIPFVYLFVEH